MKIAITPATAGPFKRSTEWEGKVNEYWAQDAVVQLDEIQTVVWEVRLNSKEDAHPAGEYLIDLNSFATKKFPNTKGDVPSYGVNRPEFKALKLIPIKAK